MSKHVNMLQHSRWLFVALVDLTVKCNGKTTAILSSKRFHPVEELFLLYKAEGLGFLEYRKPVLYHCHEELLQPL